MTNQPQAKFSLCLQISNLKAENERLTRQVEHLEWENRRAKQSYQIVSSCLKQLNSGLWSKVVSNEVPLSWPAKEKQ